MTQVMDVDPVAQAGFRHAEAVALFALPDVGQVHRVGDHFDPRETLTDQRLSGFDAGAPVVEYDAAQFGVRHFAVEQYDGDILQGDIADNFIGTFAGDDDQPVDALVAENLDQVFEFLRIFVRTAEQYGILMFICAVFDAAGDVGEKLVGDVRYDYPDGVRLAAAKRTCGIVGLVVKLFGDLQNPLRRLFVDAVGLLAVGFVVHDE